MLKHYETVFIATPVLSETQMKEAVTKYLDLIRDNGGEIVYDEDWGLKKLAYTIQKKTTGFYHLIEFVADSQFIDVLETQYKRDERIIRYLTVSLDKNAVAYAEKRRSNKSSNSDKTEVNKNKEQSKAKANENKEAEEE
ncbi:MAG: 30S ribosomal protein S6 [Bacteroidales bacterium]|jgi:small subunit ribosomal protein S6|nr:30S ribosomal protein S6 [Bacteroidales bacterium]